MPVDGETAQVERRRLVAIAVLTLALVIAVTVVLLARSPSGEAPGAAAPGPAHSASATAAGVTTTTVRPATTTSKPPSTVAPHDPARDFAPALVTTIHGPISPKSVTATGAGLVFAQNMMYRHTVTVYDAAGTLVKTIPDRVTLAAFGLGGHPGTSRGAPVEAAADPAHRYVYVTNYSMYGADFGPEGSDNCSGPGGLSPSYVYRVNVASLAIDGVAQVGMVPKYVAVTPDNRYVLVTNWCSYDLSVIDRRTFREVRRIPLGAYPRGIAVDRGSAVAYVAVMGTYDVARIDLRSFATSWFRGVGRAPRHLVLAPDGRRLFVTLNGGNRVVAVDTATGRVVAGVTTGTQPRSMAISADGQALYVVNYVSDTVSVLRESDLSVVRTLAVPDHPIGITYEPVQHRLWVACYTGAILVYDA